MTVLKLLSMILSPSLSEYRYTPNTHIVLYIRNTAFPIALLGWTSGELGESLSDVSYYESLHEADTVAVVSEVDNDASIVPHAVIGDTVA